MLYSIQQGRRVYGNDSQHIFMFAASYDLAPERRWYILRLCLYPTGIQPNLTTGISSSEALIHVS